MHPSTRGEGFVTFFKRYARSWQHGVATAALTAFGLLTVVDPLFVVVALLAYAAPPVVLYLRAAPSRPDPGSDPGADGATGVPDGRRAETTRRTETRETAHRAGTRENDSGADGVGTEADESETATWTAPTVPTEEALYDAAVVGERAYAVGGGGTLLADHGDGWTDVVSDGPRAGSNALHGVDTTDGGVWFAGAGGAVGRFDPTTGRHVDHSAPDGDTTNLANLAAAGSDGDETVLLVDGSGRVRRGRYSDGTVAWSEPVTPGGGSSIAGVTLPVESVGYVCDTSQCVFATDDGGRGFHRVGLEADGTLTAVAATGPEHCLVCDDDGVVYRYDGRRWTPERVDDGALWALAATGAHGLAGGDDGTVFERGPETRGWERSATPTSVALAGAGLGRTRAVVVGESGTVVERPLGRPGTGGP
jgi:hypothetical protein